MTSEWLLWSAPVVLAIVAMFGAVGCGLGTMGTALAITFHYAAGLGDDVDAIDVRYEAILGEFVGTKVEIVSKIDNAKGGTVTTIVGTTDDDHPNTESVT